MKYVAQEVDRTEHGVAYVTPPPENHYQSRPQQQWWHPWIALADGGRIDLEPKAVPIQAEHLARNTLRGLTADMICERCGGEGAVEDRFTHEVDVCQSCGGSGSWT